MEPDGQAPGQETSWGERPRGRLLESGLPPFPPQTSVPIQHAVTEAFGCAPRGQGFRGLCAF